MPRLHQNFPFSFEAYITPRNARNFCLFSVLTALMTYFLGDFSCEKGFFGRLAPQIFAISFILRGILKKKVF
jgi:hypothetical protein